MSNAFIDELEIRKARATQHLNDNGFDIVTQNGQRISSNRIIDETPFKNVEYNEIFIGKIPRDLFEDELLPRLEQIGGRIVKIRLMMDFSGFNRGFGFVKYTDTFEAIKACSLLDGQVLRANTNPIGVKISLDNKALFFGNLPPSCTARQLKKSLERVEISGITHTKMADSPQLARPNRRNMQHQINTSGLPFYGSHRYQAAAIQPEPTGRFGYVFFESHEAATKARRLLMPSDIKIMDRKITLDWAKSELPAHLVELQRALTIAARQNQMQMSKKSLLALIDQNQNEEEFFSHWSPLTAPPLCY